MPPKQGKAGRKGKVVKEEEVVILGPKVAEGEHVFGVAHIYASFNDTFLHITDLSGKVKLSKTGHSTDLNFVLANLDTSSLNIIRIIHVKFPIFAFI